MKARLRIAVLLDDQIIPAWMYQSLSFLKSSTSCEVVSLIKNAEFLTKDPLYVEASSSSKHAVYRFYKRLDAKYYKPKPDAFKERDVFELFNLDLTENLSKLTFKKDNIDILLQFGGKTLVQDSLDLVRYGVWSLNVGSSRANDHAPDLYFNVLNKTGEIDLSLQMKAKGLEKVIYSSYSLTNNLSVKKTQNACFWKLATFFDRSINALYENGETVFLNDPKHRVLDLTTKAVHRATLPSNYKSIIALIFFNWVRLKNSFLKKFYFDQWILLFKLGDSFPGESNWAQYHQMLPPKDRFWADPHVVYKNGKYYIFIEELLFAENCGFISVIEMTEDGQYTEPVTLLKKEYHMSFPFIFEENDTFYMIPETKQSGAIELYKCVDFPYNWTMESPIMEAIKAIDTVILYAKGTYWLFTNTASVEGISFYDELHLYYADELTGANWQAHPQNPIVSDVRNARMAGAIIEHDNVWYRPSQNCAKHYGYGMKMNKIVELSKTEYKEETVYDILPNWDDKVKSTHSFAKAANLTVIDAQLKRRK